MSQSVRPIVTDGSRPARTTLPVWKTGWLTFSIIRIIITTLALKTCPVSLLGRCMGMLKDCVTKCGAKLSSMSVMRATALSWPLITLDLILTFYFASLIILAAQCIKFLFLFCGLFFCLLHFQYDYNYSYCDRFLDDVGIMYRRK